MSCCEGTLTLSNRLELLLFRMITHISSTRKSPFDRILIIVPSSAMKMWMMHMLSDVEGIAFGLDIVPLSEALPKLIPLLAAKKDYTVPGIVELALAIDQELDGIEELACFQGEKKAKTSLDIAKLFLKWGEFAASEVREWKGDEHFQAKLWKQIFSGHRVPLYMFVEDLKLQSPQIPLQVHLFGISTLSDVKQDFFSRVNHVAPVHTWILSPSRMFWSDSRSEREQWRLISKLQKKKINEGQIEVLEGLLDEGNPLINNNGRLGRSWTKTLEEAQREIEEVYAISAQAAEMPEYQDFLLDGVEEIPAPKLSLLQCVQADLLLMRQVDHPLEIEDDLSIEIHASTSLLREVEALHQTLLRACDQEGVLPEEILVMVPALEKYTPFIKMVFQDSSLSFEIVDRAKGNESTCVTAFFALLKLAKSRFDLPEVIALFENHAFNFKTDDFHEIKSLFEKEGIQWGLNQNHREEYLNGVPLEKKSLGTWEEGLNLLVQSLSTPTSQAVLNFTQGESFGRFIAKLKQLKIDLTPFASDEKRSMQEWSELLSKLCQAHLIDDDETEELTRIFKKCARFKHGQVSSDGLLVYLNMLLEETGESFRRQQLQAVRFCSLLPMRAIPAKVIALVGLNGDEFPRQEKKSPFQCIKAQTYIPTSLDYDRFLFLESLLSAREKWILSYVAPAGESPSDTVQEVIDYLDLSYRMGGACPSAKLIFNHPELPFDSRYFLKNSRLPNYSKKEYRSALAAQEQVKIAASLLFKSPLKEILTSPAYITLKELKSSFYNPIKFYLNRTLNIYLKESEDIHPLMAEFEHDRFQKSSHLKMALIQPFDQAIQSLDQQGKLPHEPFKTPYILRLKEEVREWKEALDEMDDLFEVEFSHGCQSPYLAAPGKYKVPPYICNINGKAVAITGTLSTISSKGFMCMKNNKPESIIPLIPEFLLHSSLPDAISAKQIYFLKNSKVENIPNLSAEKIISHYMRTLQEPVPSLPSWISPMLEKDPEALKKAIELSCEDSFRKKGDPYLQWALPNLDAVDPQEIIEMWHAELEKLLSEFVLHRSVFKSIW